MMEKQKQIEESKSCYSCNHYYACEDCYKAFTRNKDYFKRNIAHNRDIAMLCKCYQPKIPEGAVLMGEEYKKLRADSYNLKRLYEQYPYRVLVGFNSMVFSQDHEHYEKLFDDIEKRISEEIRKETVEKFAEKMKLEIKSTNANNFFIQAWVDKIDEICKEIIGDEQ